MSLINKNIINNKKGGEKYLSIWWFFVLTVIAGGIVIAVLMLNLADINTKSMEADILANKFIECSIDAGYINENILSENFDIFKECYFSREILDESGKYYLKFELYNMEDCSPETPVACKNPLVTKQAGVADFTMQCGLKGKSYPLCSEKYIYVLDKDNKKMILHVAAGSNQEITGATLK